MGKEREKRLNIDVTKIVLVYNTKIMPVFLKYQ
jgi:hypothetical protein